MVRAVSPLVFAVSMLVALLCQSGCGRFGVELLKADAGVDGVDPRDADQGAPEAGIEGDAGSCPTPCANAHGTADCSTGTCRTTCTIGFADCDGRVDNGCETDTASDSQSCGACSLACTNDHGSTMCSVGICSPLCAAGFADCEQEVKNGCEANLESVTSCGACGRSCLNDHGQTTCVAGTCQPTCAAGYESCDGDAANGCEAHVTDDPMHCGGCTTVCDPSYQVCVEGICELSPCAAGRGECDANPAMACETDLRSSTSSCGFCGNVCSAANGTAACVSSTCTVASCRAGYGNCDAMVSNGCEVALATSTAHCGGCGAPCSNAHGSTSCVASTCTPSCSSGFGDCDSSRQNGCETGLNSITNCGTCGRSCPANGGTPVCSAGICSTQCDLTGLYALKLSVPATWPGSGLLAGGSGTFVHWLKAQLTQSGSSLSGTLVPCGESVPDFDAVPAIREHYGITYPTAIFERALPSTVTSGALSAITPGSTFSLVRSAYLFGATLANPVTDAWPTRGSLRSVDVDADGKPGATAPYKTGSGYTSPPTNSFGTSRAVRSYMATRMVFSLSGTLNSCTQSSGAVTAQDIDFLTIGCGLSTGRDCGSSDIDHLTTNAPDYRPNAGTYTLVKVAGTASCTDVRAAAP